MPPSERSFRGQGALSCKNCQKKKVKCDLNTPCSACQKRYGTSILLEKRSSIFGHRRKMVSDG
jgi:Fungal Zn(2)-Cys(6) binuclear cluster domain